MKTINKTLISIATVLSFGAVIANVYAQPGPFGNGMGPGMMRGDSPQGQQIGPSANLKIMRDLMTPAERLEIMDKLIDANSFDERQIIIKATRTELEKRAKEKGITLPSGYGPQMMFGRNFGRGCR